MTRTVEATLETGERVYRTRLDVGAGFSASPIAVDGKIYFASEDGVVFVVRAGRGYEPLETLDMGEALMATPAVSDGILFLRGRNHLFAVGRLPAIADPLFRFLLLLLQFQAALLQSPELLFQLRPSGAGLFLLRPVAGDPLLQGSMFGGQLPLGSLQLLFPQAEALPLLPDRIHPLRHIRPLLFQFFPPAVQGLPPLTDSGQRL